MNEIATRQQSLSSASQQHSVSTELAKMLGLVAPVTMTTDQQTLWLASAVEALGDVRADEIQAVSVEVRKTVHDHRRIVPEISRLVGEERARKASLSRAVDGWDDAVKALPAKKHVMDRDRSTFSAPDWAELSEHLERQGSKVRYGPDGTKYTVE